MDSSERKIIMPAATDNAVAATDTTYDPNIEQRRAADPQASVWVGASAGSGKTKVLTDRLLRLLLPDNEGRTATPPHRILCLTFTKAAASEMALRLNKKLGQWAVMPHDELANDLKDNLLGRVPTDEEINAARSLFAEVIDTPGGLKIMTIHAFCQSLLGRFPLEAGLSPNFKALDDGQARLLLTQARDNVLTSARADLETPEGLALSYIAAIQSEDNFIQILQSIVKERQQLGDLLRDNNGFELLCNNIATYLDVPPAQTREGLYESALLDSALDMVGLRGACKALADLGTAKEQEKSLTLQLWLDGDHAQRTVRFHEYQAFFLKADGDIRKSLATKKVTAGAPDAVQALLDEAARLQALEDKGRAINIVTATTHLLTLGLAVLARYEALKAHQSALDFDDLINKSLALLRSENMTGWVMYKLDGGLDHVLIDEAQDTNPEQWEIIQLLTADFFSGDAVRSEEKRTIFSVGDEKQSIYSFQRAAPEKFQDMQRYFADKVQASQNYWRGVDMKMSFRSVPAILSFVDEVFAPEERRGGLGKSRLEHLSHKDKQPGYVEVWPLFTTPDKIEKDPWSPPISEINSRSSAAQLAKHIGDNIEGWINDKMQLADKSENTPPRHVQAGDIMILVRRRNNFVNQMIKALKTRGIPVSGVDRMVLKEQLPVQDLAAFASFTLLPDDDLSLACILKSPLIGWDDKMLEDVAAYRDYKQPLWEALQKKDQHKDVTEYLKRFITRAAHDYPYEFFSRLLQEPCPASPQGGYHAMTGRLGIEALDPLDEFLNMALSYEHDFVPNLQGFLKYLQSGHSDIKRDQEEAGGYVRIMTIHGAKGLQAPIVILPDTVRTGRTPVGNDYRLLWPNKVPITVPLWSPRKDDDCKSYATLLDGYVAKQDEEYSRLLYVAMTRAEEQLYIAGYCGAKKPHEDSWYYYMKDAAARLPGTREENFVFSGSSSDPEEQTAQKLCYGARIYDENAIDDVKSGNKEVTGKSGASWLYERPTPEGKLQKPLMPSRPDEEEPAALSPLMGENTGRFRRGVVSHRLLQLLPDLPSVQRRIAAEKFICNHAGDLSEQIQESIVTEVMAVLDNPAWTDLFGPQSKAEVPVTGLVNKTLISGQIDRLLVTDDAIWIVDFKTNRPPPADEKGVADIYRKQMKSYGDIVSNIYKGRKVRCFLLWTDGAQLMEINI